MSRCVVHGFVALGAHSAGRDRLPQQRWHSLMNSLGRGAKGKPVRFSGIKCDVACRSGFAVGLRLPRPGLWGKRRLSQD